MPIDASIPLQARAPQVQAFDPTQTYLTFAQLKRLQQQRQLADLQLQEAQQLQGEKGRLRDLYQAWGASGRPAIPGTPGTPGRPAPQLMGRPLSSLSAPPGNYVEVSSEAPALADPDQGQLATPGTPGQPGKPGMSFEELERRGHAAAPTLWPEMKAKLQDAQLKGLQVQKARREELASVLEYAMRTAPLVRDQMSWDLFLDSVRALGFPMEHAPREYSPQVIQDIMQVALPLKDKLDFALKQQEMQLKTGKVNYGLGNELDAAVYARYGMQLGPQGRPTSAMVEQAKKDVEESRVRVSAAQGSSNIIQTPQGYARVNPRSGAVEMVSGPQGTLQPKPTEAEQRASSYAERAKQAHDIVVAMEQKQVLPGLGTRTAEGLPLGVGNYLLSPEFQQYRQAVNQFAQALLRKESGAVINEDEYRMTDRTYFPQPGDEPQVLQQKRTAREGVIAQLTREGRTSGGAPAITPGDPGPPPAGQTRYNTSLDGKAISVDAATPEAALAMLQQAYPGRTFQLTPASPAASAPTPKAATAGDVTKAINYAKGKNVQWSVEQATNAIASYRQRGLPLPWEKP